MPKTDVITQNRLKEVLHYDPESGVFAWIKRISHRIKVGDVAGTMDTKGYIVIGVDGVLYKAHRLAFLYMDGVIPIQIDHEGHKKSDNRWDKIHPSTDSDNRMNMPISKKNKSGYCGVSWDRYRGKWSAKIQVNHKTIHLGRFTEKKSAELARQAANKKYNFHENHGS